MPARPVPTLSLRPDPGAAAVWSAWSGLLVAAGVWFAMDAPRSLIAWATLFLFALVAAYFVVQLAVPQLFEVRLTDDELQARVLWMRRRITWDRVHVARVQSLFGDPMLELQVHDADVRDDPSRLTTLGVLLPVGTDTSALHRFLAARLGTGSLRAPDRLEPLDA